MQTRVYFTRPYLAFLSVVIDFQQRGINYEKAMAAMMSGFCRDVFNELPDELGAEVNQLMSLKLEGSVSAEVKHSLSFWSLKLIAGVEILDFGAIVFVICKVVIVSYPNFCHLNFM
ncbi:hypothetical protein HAX54_048439 [Datura stramonium]|uniref:Uncharacterized protein n=1 Tax=Datura stramonium TaxID=4076 RepID=A0ABS8RHC2_DATST|nr:hypothetical protein [Datura stramonium]